MDIILYVYNIIKLYQNILVRVFLGKIRWGKWLIKSNKIQKYDLIKRIVFIQGSGLKALKKIT